MDSITVLVCADTYAMHLKVFRDQLADDLKTLDQMISRYNHISEATRNKMEKVVAAATIKLPDPE